ncbi:MAG: flagellin [Terracidiphilus sp.]|jgi:flagellin
MSISILNNISSLIAENAVSNTQSSLQSTLQQLATGLRINSGAEDPAGLSIADGLGANIAALNQSTQNVSNGIGLLQTADGALSQVVTVLNQAVTIATEASNGGLSSSQSAALNTQFQSILSEIDQIGSTTNFNGASVFGAAGNSTTSTQGNLLAATALTSGSVTTISDSETGGTFVYKAGASSTVTTLQSAIAAAVTAGQLSAGTALTLNGAGQAVISNTNVGDVLTATTTDSVLGGFNSSGTVGGSGATVFTSDGTSGGAASLTTAITALSSANLGLSTSDLSTSADAKSALTLITAAISTVAAERGGIGASVNQLTADTNVENTEVQNLTSSQNSIQNADIATTTSNLAQYNILEQTGFAALSQSQQAEQNVLKLLQ